MSLTLVTDEPIVEEEEVPERLISELFDYLDGPGKDAILSFCDAYEIDGIRRMERNMRIIAAQNQDSEYADVASVYMVTTKTNEEAKISFVNVGCQFNVVALGDEWVIAFQFVRRLDRTRAPIYLGLQTRF
ncbi:MAG: hypothetical protein ACTSX1_15745 [Candidatus Heimdallarchaeaceae archaeon]